MNALRKFIDTKGLTIAEAARVCGVNPVSVNRHYHGERGISPDFALIYNKSFGIPLTDLLRCRKNKQSEQLNA